MSLRDMTEALYPEAVGRRRAEEVRALATSELRQLVPVERPSDSHQALVQVCGAAELPLPLTVSYAYDWLGETFSRGSRRRGALRSTFFWYERTCLLLNCERGRHTPPNQQVQLAAKGEHAERNAAH